MWETSLGLATPRSTTIHAGISRAIDRQKDPDVPSPLSLSRSRDGSLSERSNVCQSLSSVSATYMSTRNRCGIVDPPMNRPIATRGRGDPCFCIALRGICISVNHCWIYVYDVETFSNLYLLHLFLFPTLFALPRGDRCERRDRYGRS